MIEIKIGFKIVEIILSVLNLLLIVVGIFIPLKETKEQAKKAFEERLKHDQRIWKIRLIDEQISKYYGPISAILDEQRIITNRIEEQMGKRPIFKQGQNRLSDLDVDKQLIWKRFIDTYSIPLRHDILEIMRNNKHLEVRNLNFDAVARFIDYSLGWELLDNQKKSGIPNYYEYYYAYNYPKLFDEYINSTLRNLVEKKEILISCDNSL